LQASDSIVYGTCSNYKFCFNYKFYNYHYNTFHKSVGVCQKMTAEAPAVTKGMV